MDLSDPTRAVTPSLDGPVLAVLASAGKPLTVGEVARQVVRGSEIGVRRCLDRLVAEGMVVATTMGRNRVHEINRDHLAANIAQQLADLWPNLLGRIRADFKRWAIKPAYAAIFGSAARRDGDAMSDIDLFLVHPPFPNDPKPPTQPNLLVILAQLKATPMSVASHGVHRWNPQVDRLKERIRRWTGNPVQVVEMSWAEWLAFKDGDGLAAEIRRDAVEVTP